MGLFLKESKKQRKEREKNEALEKARQERRAEADKKRKEEDAKALEESLKNPNEGRPDSVVIGEDPDPVKTRLTVEKEGSDYPLRETETSKYLDTMWFVKETFEYASKTETFAFEAVVYPLGIRDDGYPVPVIACVGREGIYKTVVSGDAYSVSIVQEGLIISFTGFFHDDMFDARISVRSTDKDPGIVKSVDREIYTGKVLPANFGKKIFENGDTLELFPLSLKNNSGTGCAPFLWIHRKKDGSLTYGTSDQQQKAVIPFTSGMETVIAFWNRDEDNNSKFNADIS